MRFECGDRIRTRDQRTGGHTRLPHYLSRRSGRIIAVLGEFRFADEGAERGVQARNERLYTVEFSDGPHAIHADLFEPYLEGDA